MGSNICIGDDIHGRVSFCAIFSLLKQDMMRRKFWIWSGVAGMVVLSGWVLYVSSKQIDRNQRIEQEVALLQVEADKIRHENETLTEKIQYFSSQDFREQEAKKKLGLKKTEEIAVIIKSSPSHETESVSASEQDTQQPATPARTFSQPKKWWGIFFGKS